MSHYDLYRAQQQQQKSKQHLQDYSYSSSRLLRQQHSSYLPRNSRRDVFSDQCVDDDTLGFSSFARANTDEPKEDTKQEDTSIHQEQLGGITHHSENIVGTWDNMSTFSGNEESQTDLSFADAETLKASSCHSSSIQTSSIYIEDSEPRIHPRDNHLLSPEPGQPRPPLLRVESNDGSSHNSTSSGLDSFCDDDVESGPIITPETTGSNNKPPNSKKLILLAGMALCLLLMVVAGTITWWVLGSRKEKELALSRERPTGMPSPMPSSAPTTVVPNTPPPATGPIITTTPEDAILAHHQQWASQFLSNWTLQMIQQSSSPQAQAFEWIQNDPYFNSSTISLNITSAEVTTKQLDRFALATLFYAIGHTWQGWLSDEDECQWPFYSCAPTSTAPPTGRRRLRAPSGTTLEIRNARATGILPAEVSLMTSLQVLAIHDDPISNNDTFPGLHGRLPSEVGLLTDLRVLDLHGHTLVGFIPSELGQLTNLVELYLHNNSFQIGAVVPTELCDLPSLHTITVDCTAVVCHCGCTCPTGGTSLETTHHNIFDHDNNGTAAPSPVTNPPLATTPSPTTIMPGVSNVPLPTPEPTYTIMTNVPQPTPMPLTMESWNETDGTSLIDANNTNHSISVPIML
ncbi:Leucine Rich Repeat [Seminavis robusta]|uniref:Leucine Rich Repeat n=1 Tax=Seminavis robusta TaxID=568900 RepID=A0A9N8E7H5_9STRA|nr:Leucine Rich Repeat [Seminavis robusta]|eukprot:Sro595_g172630.1 Leucine Rich Repeat (630) ;mRNA; f:21567-23456